MAHPESPTAAPQASPFDRILEQSCDLFCERLDEALAGMLDKVEPSLTALINDTQNRETQDLYRETRDKVLGERKSIEDYFRKRYQKEFQTRANRVRKIGQSFSDTDFSALELDLVGDDDLNETLKFNEMASKLRRFCDEELSALDQRVGVLLGDADLQSEDNPFSPQAVCDAYKHTCRHVDSSANVRMVLLKLFDDHVADELRSIYKAVNALLVQNSILPKIRFSVAKGQEGKTPAGAGAKPAEAAAGAAPAGDKPPVSEQDFFAMMQNLMAASPALAQLGAAGGQVVMLQGADLLNSLTRLQQGNAGAMTASDGQTVTLPTLTGEPGTTNVLRELKETSVGGGMAQMDAMTLDIVAMVFDQLFDEPKIPLSVKGLIGRLQIPMLKVAIADKALFSKKTHPARQFLDKLGEISARLPADFNSSNPLFARFDTIVQELMDGFQENVEIFDAAREKLQVLIAEEDQRADQEASVVAKRIQETESLALAKTIAQEEIKARIKARKGTRMVHEFLVQHWVKFLLLVHVKRGRDSEAWKSSIETMDQLCWSVEPKKSNDERRKLATMVPGMLKRLSTGLKVVGVEEAATSKFFADLMKRHTEEMSKEEKVVAVPDAVAPSEPAKPDAAPAEVAAAAAKEAVKPADTAPGKVPAPAEGKKADAKPVAPPQAAKPAPPTSPPPAAKPAPPTSPPPAAKAPDGKPAAAPKVAAQAAPATPGKPPAPVVAKAAAAKAAPPGKEAAKPAPAKSVEAAAAQTGDSDSLDFTESITVRNPFGGTGVVKVDQMDFTDLPGASPTQARQGAKDAELTGHLKEGTWVEVIEKNEEGEESGRRPAKLNFISPMKTSYLFIDRTGKTVLECSRAELARRFRLKEVVVMDEAPLFDRIMGGIVGKMKSAPAPAPAKPG